MLQSQFLRLAIQKRKMSCLRVVYCLGSVYSVVCTTLVLLLVSHQIRMSELNNDMIKPLLITIAEMNSQLYRMEESFMSRTFTNPDDTDEFTDPRMSLIRNEALPFCRINKTFIPPEYNISFEDNTMDWPSSDDPMCQVKAIHASELAGRILAVQAHRNGNDGYWICPRSDRHGHALPNQPHFFRIFRLTSNFIILRNREGQFLQTDRCTAAGYDHMEFRPITIREPYGANIVFEWKSELKLPGYLHGYFGMNREIGVACGSQTNTPGPPVFTLSLYEPCV